MKKKAILFDLDGVLVFTDQFHFQAWKGLADSLGIPFDEQDNLRLRGVSRMQSLEIILEKADRAFSEEEKAALCEQKNEAYKVLLSSMTPASVDPETRSALKQLKEKGVLLGIGSSSKNTRYILEKTELLPYFDIVVDGTMISRSKPDPEVFLKGAEGLGLAPEECYVIEDATAGIDAAVAGGFTAVGIGPAREYEKADKKIDKISDLLRYFPKLSIRGLGKVYSSGNVRAVTDFNLDINEEEFVVFVGPSGCGKSTVLRMIAGLEEVTEGQIFLNGEEISSKEARERNIAMVFQNYALYPHLTVRQNIAFPLVVGHNPFRHFLNWKYHKKRVADINAKVEAAAEKIGLTPYLDRKPANLSGGQRQRVALGRAIVRNPQVFLLDEPLSNLDAKMRIAMRAEISKLHDKLKTIFIYVTHDQTEAMTMGSLIVVLKDGVIQQVATPKDLFLHPVNLFVAGFIGTPQMNFLTGKVKKSGDVYSVLLGETELKVPNERMAGFDDQNLDQDVIVGLRPKAIVIEGDPGFKEPSFSGKIELVEGLGEDTLLYLRLAGTDAPIIASTTGLERFHKGQTVRFTFDVSNVYLFSKETERSLIQ